MDAADAIRRCEAFTREADAAKLRCDVDVEAESLTRAAACFEAHSAEPDDDGAPAIDPVATRLHAVVSQRLGAVLTKLGRVPQAIQAYQEAADAFRLVPDGAVAATECARQVLAGVKSLRSHPNDRLYLLVAKYERDQAHHAATAGSEAQQGECALHIAGIFHRRERYSEAVGRYEEAIGLFQRAADSGEREARCHHRLGDIFDHEYNDPVKAFSHYRKALRLYTEFEPLTEGRQINRLLCEARLRELGTDLAEFTDNLL
ncbi:MAG TPA: tetratricopeptide repeat protein [Chloroflexota bacterium]|nr:tetratricopeptide repeat protein [Chloroflexota bacterium]